MFSIGWTELLIVFGIWLVLFGGWRILRSLFWQSRWMIHELRGDAERAYQAELRLGESVAEWMMAKMPPDSDRSRAETIGELGRSLTRALEGRRRSIRFQVVCSRQPNAFALPGGLIFVTDALVAFCEQDHHQLAFVLAHEVAHVQRLHVRERILGSSVLSVLAGLVASGSLLGRSVRRQVNRALTSAYSQDQEFEADSDAVRLLRQAGLDFRAGERFFARLERASSGTRQHPYFATHPSLADRQTRLRATVKSMQP